MLTKSSESRFFVVDCAYQIGVDMAFSITELENLRKKLDRDRRELEERERALAKVEEMLREQSSMTEEVPIPPPVPRAESLADAVRMAVTALGNSEFGVADIEAYLKGQGFDLPKADPRSRIAMLLQNLKNSGEIILTVTGTGRAPNRYRVKK